MKSVVMVGLGKCFLLGIKSGGWVWRWVIGGFLGCVILADKYIFYLLLPE